MEETTKLIINLKEGIVEVEGTEDFVRDVYNDFKERVSRPVPLPPAPPARLEQFKATGEAEGTLAARRTTTTSRRGVAAKTGETANYKPKFNNDLNLNGLAEFYDLYAPKTHAEKILIFAAFLRDKIGISPCAADDIFTCYFTIKNKTKTPEAFVQAFRDCQSRTHYIKFISLTAIEITIPGDNFLSSKSRK